MIGTVWNLVSLNGESLVPGTTITAEFRDDGKIGGTSGCNAYNASYELSGSSITIGPAMGTLMACPEPIMDQETAYLGYLQDAARFAIKGETLTLTTGSGEDLVFEAQNQELAGTSWTVVSYNNGKEAVVSVILGTEITAAFGDDARVTGSAGCNSYFAGYEMDGTSISIGPAGATEMFCGEPEGVMDQESQYLAALQSAATYSIQGSILEFRTASGALAVSFERAGS